MKAIICEKYGDPEVVLKMKDVEKPNPKDNEVLIKVKASAVNDYDWVTTRGLPLLYRIFLGISKPRNPILGMEVAGIVEETGKSVTKFRVGDTVFGDLSDHGFGSFAEYISINEQAVAIMPDNLKFEEACSIPHASLLADQGFEKGGLKDGMEILINGAGGGVGSFALQIAKMHNCKVTGVDTGKKLDKMHALGFDHVIDYKKENFSNNGQKYDLILDCKSTKTVWTYLKSLKTNGSYITVGGKITSLLNILFLGFLPSIFTSRKTQILGLKPNKGLKKIVEMFEKGELKTVIDGPYSFAETPRLIQYFGEGMHHGKVVVRIDA
ncbi:MAG: NAD(P)-dependent alcohol dehydrogenase [Chitinophagales bacterium]|nr:NAD(P)-dependent alcohol dehydrogenase [Chitinophagales bacterium]